MADRRDEQYWLEQISRFYDGQLAADEIRSLNNRLAGDERLRLAYLEMLDVEAALIRFSRDTSNRAAGEVENKLLVDFEASASQSEANADDGLAASVGRRTAEAAAQPRVGFSEGFARAIDRHRHPVRFLATAAVLTVVMWTGWLMFVQPSQQERSADDAAQSPVPPRALARVLSSVEAQQRTGSASVQVGTELFRGQSIQLDSGMVEVRFATAARVILEGPAEFLVETNNSGRLDLGKLTARVPIAARGFAIETPTASIIDLGTEFGIEVDEAGETEVAVFDGEIQLAKHPDDGARQVLVAGQSAKITQQSQIALDATADKKREKFTRELPKDLGNLGLIARDSFGYGDGLLPGRGGLGAGWGSQWRSALTPQMQVRDRAVLIPFGEVFSTHRVLQLPGDWSDEDPLYFSTRMTMPTDIGQSSAWLRIQNEQGDAASIGALNGRFAARFESGDSNQFSRFAPGATYLVVGKLQPRTQATGYRLQAWVNPSGKEMSVNASAPLVSDTTWTAPAYLFLVGLQITAPVTIHEVRVGTRWEAVVRPPPN